MPQTLFVLLLKFGAVLSIICGFLMAVSCWKWILQCIVIVRSFLRLLKLRKLAVGKLDLSGGIHWNIPLTTMSTTGDVSRLCWAVPECFSGQPGTFSRPVCRDRTSSSHRDLGTATARVFVATETGSVFKLKHCLSKPNMHFFCARTQKLCEERTKAALFKVNFCRISTYYCPPAAPAAPAAPAPRWQTSTGTGVWAAGWLEVDQTTLRHMGGGMFKNHSLHW